jgi:predicted RNase H-like HicB family nuclease
LANRMTQLTSRIERLEAEQTAAACRPYTISLSTLAPESYTLIHPISVVLREVDDGFSADFVEANIGASGESEEEAIRNLKELIAMTFEDLEEDDSRLAPPVASQFAVLKSVLRNRNILPNPE